MRQRRGRGRGLKLHFPFLKPPAASEMPKDKLVTRVSSSLFTLLFLFNVVADNFVRSSKKTLPVAACAQHNDIFNFNPAECTQPLLASTQFTIPTVQIPYSDKCVRLTSIQLAFRLNAPSAQYRWASLYSFWADPGRLYTLNFQQTIFFYYYLLLNIIYSSKCILFSMITECFYHC